MEETFLSILLVLNSNNAQLSRVMNCASLMARVKGDASSLQSQDTQFISCVPKTWSPKKFYSVINLLLN